MATKSSLPDVALFVEMALFVLVGSPMVTFLWWVLGDLLAFNADPLLVVLAIPVLVLFVGWLVLLARRIEQWTAQDVR